MKKFLTKSILFFLLVITIISTVLITSGGYVDYFYEKFTTPKAKSLILGDSRSMQGIQPSVIDDYFAENSHFDLPMLNYSFTIAQISYGPLYDKSVEKKLDKSAKNGLFILTVNPWILSSRENDDEKNGVFFEENMPPHNMHFVNHNPNFEYLIKNYSYFHFKSIIRRTSKMHKDGWLEESNLPKDTIMLNQWKAKQIEMYSGYASEWKKSEFRLNSFEKLIKLLDQYGDVILLRMPIDEKIIKVEKTYWPDFDLKINEIANRTKINYINFTQGHNIYKTYDGNHLDKYGGVTFTKNLCDSITKRLSIKK